MTEVDHRFKHPAGARIIIVHRPVQPHPTAGSKDHLTPERASDNSVKPSSLFLELLKGVLEQPNIEPTETLPTPDEDPYLIVIWYGSNEAWGLYQLAQLASQLRAKTILSSNIRPGDPINISVKIRDDGAVTYLPDDSTDYFLQAVLDSIHQTGAIEIKPEAHKSLAKFKKAFDSDPLVSAQKILNQLQKITRCHQAGLLIVNNITGSDTKPDDYWFSSQGSDQQQAQIQELSTDDPIARLCRDYQKATGAVVVFTQGQEAKGYGLSCSAVLTGINTVVLMPIKRNTKDTQAIAHLLLLFNNWAFPSIYEFWLLENIEVVLFNTIDQWLYRERYNNQLYTKDQSLQATSHRQAIAPLLKAWHGHPHIKGLWIKLGYTISHRDPQCQWLTSCDSLDDTILAQLESHEMLPEAQIEPVSVNSEMRWLARYALTTTDNHHPDSVLFVLADSKISLTTERSAINELIHRFRYRDGTLRLASIQKNTQALGSLLNTPSDNRLDLNALRVIEQCLKDQTAADGVMISLITPSVDGPKINQEFFSALPEDAGKPINRPLQDEAGFSEWVLSNNEAMLVESVKGTITDPQEFISASGKIGRRPSIKGYTQSKAGLSKYLKNTTSILTLPLRHGYPIERAPDEIQEQNLIAGTIHLWRNQQPGCSVPPFALADVSERLANLLPHIEIVFRRIKRFEILEKGRKTLERLSDIVKPEHPVHQAYALALWELLSISKTRHGIVLQLDQHRETIIYCAAVVSAKTPLEEEGKFKGWGDYAVPDQERKALQAVFQQFKLRITQPSPGFESSKDGPVWKHCLKKALKKHIDDQPSEHIMRSLSYTILDDYIKDHIDPDAIAPQYLFVVFELNQHQAKFPYIHSYEEDLRFWAANQIAVQLSQLLKHQYSDYRANYVLKQIISPEDKDNQTITYANPTDPNDWLKNLRRLILEDVCQGAVTQGAVLTYVPSVNETAEVLVQRPSGEGVNIVIAELGQKELLEDPLTQKSCQDKKDKKYEKGRPYTILAASDHSDPLYDDQNPTLLTDLAQRFGWQGIGSWMNLPIMHNGRLYGVMKLFLPDDAPFLTQDHINVCHKLTRHIGSELYRTRKPYASQQIETELVQLMANQGESFSAQLHQSLVGLAHRFVKPHCQVAFSIGEKDGAGGIMHHGLSGDNKLVAELNRIHQVWSALSEPKKVELYALSDPAKHHALALKIDLVTVDPRFFGVLFMVNTEPFHPDEQQDALTIADEVAKITYQSYLHYDWTTQFGTFRHAIIRFITWWPLLNGS